MVNTDTRTLLIGMLLFMASIDDDSKRPAEVVSEPKKRATLWPLAWKLQSSNEVSRPQTALDVLRSAFCNQYDWLGPDRWAIRASDGCSRRAAHVALLCADRICDSVGSGERLREEPQHDWPRK